jgi:broad specificity phosphatase PhoE
MLLRLVVFCVLIVPLTLISQVLCLSYAASVDPSLYKQLPSFNTMTSNEDTTTATVDGSTTTDKTADDEYHHETEAVLPQPALISHRSSIVRFDMEGMAYTDTDPRANKITTNYQKLKSSRQLSVSGAGDDGGDDDAQRSSLESSLITNKQIDLSSSMTSSRGLHRRRTLYLIRHGEAEHNVLEKAAQDTAKAEAEKLGLSPSETWERMEEARKAVLDDVKLRDARLTEKGREQARAAATKLERIVAEGKAHPPTEAMCSPLTRCLETCQILLENYQIRAHIRQELQERQTLYPPDTPKPLHELISSISTDDLKGAGDVNDNNNNTTSVGRFVLNKDDWKTSPEDAEVEAQCRESKEMLRERASQLFDILMEMEHRHVLVVSHKG